MELNWLIYPAIFVILFGAYCHAMRRYAGATWGEIFTLGFHHAHGLDVEQGSQTKPIPPARA